MLYVCYIAAQCVLGTKGKYDSDFIHRVKNSSILYTCVLHVCSVLSCVQAHSIVLSTLSHDNNTGEVFKLVNSIM